MSAIFIHGPRGSGKTTHAEALRKFYGKRIVIDGVEDESAFARCHIPRDALVLSINPFPGSIPIDTALDAAGIKRIRK